MDSSTNKVILTIDDETYIRQSIKAYLEDFDFTVFEAGNGKKGLEILEANKIDLILLDLRMPEMNGLQVLKVIQKKSPDTPVIVASGTGHISAVVEALHLGAWDYILKPMEDMNILNHAITKCLKESQLKKENKIYQERLEELVKARTEELENSKKRYKAVFEYTGTASVILEPDYTISMANSQFCEIVDLKKSEIEGTKKWHDFVADDHKNIINKFNEQSELDTITKPEQHEIIFISTNGKKKYTYVTLARLPGVDKITASLLDITEKKEAEKRWYHLEKQLRNAQKAAVRAADLVGQILSVNRSHEEEKKPVNIHLIAKEVIKLLKCSIPSTIKITDNIDKTCGAVAADPSMIHQVIMNLSTNAFHAMEINGGELTLSLNQGTAFTIMLLVDQSKPEKKYTSKPDILKNTKGGKILFVDDNKDIVKMCKQGLEAINYTVIHFSSSIDALNYYKKHHYDIDIVVTDQTMPKKTGIEIAKEMREINQTIPIILCSGYAEAINIEEIKMAGIKKFIKKPLSLDELSHAIQNILND